jgi:serine/threonine protein kinase
MPLADSFGLSGRVIDQLRFEEAVGEGGFSLVYRGHHTGLDEPVAIKCLKLPQTLEPDLVEQFILRFRAECKICYRLSQGSLDIVRSVTSGTTYVVLLVIFAIAVFAGGAAIGFAFFGHP